MAGLVRNVTDSVGKRDGFLSLTLTSMADFLIHTGHNRQGQGALQSEWYPVLRKPLTTSFPCIRILHTAWIAMEAEIMSRQAGEPDLT